MAKPAAGPLPVSLQGAADDPVMRSPSGSPFLAHHFDHMDQQAGAARFGMWLFLVTEVLLFSGLFCLYAVYRHNHPDLFRYGAQFLDTGWGALNTTVLLFSSLTMALAVRAAQTSDKRGLVVYLFLTIFCGVDFLGVKWIEYRHKFHEHLVGGRLFYERPQATPDGDIVASVAAGAALVTPSAPVVPDAEKGRKLFLGTCAACHGQDGMGAAIKGKSIVTSKFVAERDDAALVAYIKKGRAADDPLNTTGLTMLPRGGNPALKDPDLQHIVAFIRMLQKRGGGAGDGGPEKRSNAASTTEITTIAPPSVPPDPQPAEATPLPTASTGGSDVPPNAHMFFGIYFLMTGLHGLHVLAGMCVLIWLLRRAIKGHFDAGYFAPVEMGGLYWHLVDLIWIYLFPLLYLIH